MKLCNLFTKPGVPEQKGFKIIIKFIFSLLSILSLFVGLIIFKLMETQEILYFNNDLADTNCDRTRQTIISQIILSGTVQLQYSFRGANPCITPTYKIISSINRKSCQDKLIESTHYYYVWYDSLSSISNSNLTIRGSFATFQRGVDFTNSLIVCEDAGDFLNIIDLHEAGGTTYSNFDISILNQNVYNQMESVIVDAFNSCTSVLSKLGPFTCSKTVRNGAFEIISYSLSYTLLLVTILKLILIETLPYKPDIGEIINN